MCIGNLVSGRGVGATYKANPASARGGPNFLRGKVARRQRGGGGAIYIESQLGGQKEAANNWCQLSGVNR